MSTYIIVDGIASTYTLNDQPPYPSSTPLQPHLDRWHGYTYACVAPFQIEHWYMYYILCSTPIMEGEGVEPAYL